MSDKLDGSFSGLWTCELCGKTGTDCTCEHYQRGGNVWGWYGTPLADCELATEYWSSAFELALVTRDWIDRGITEQEEAYTKVRKQVETLERLAKTDYASINNYL